MSSTRTWSAPAGTTGLIFDCDGTLADTMPVHYKAWLAMLGRFGIPFPEPQFYAMGGMPTAQIIRVLAADAGVAVTDVDAMVHEKEQGFLTYLDAVSPIEPVLAIAAAYRGKLPIAVASGGYRDTITRTLDRIAVRDWFNALVTAEDTTRHKPEPDVFLGKRLAAWGCGLPAAWFFEGYGHRAGSGARREPRHEERGCATVGEAQGNANHLAA